MGEHRLKRLRSVIGIFLLLALLFPVQIPAALTEEQDETVRVGIFDLGKFMTWEEDGSVSGYNIDYLEKIAEVTHWNYEYVKCENWVDATEKLESGEIDLLAPAQATEELSARFGYTVLPMGTEAAAIYTGADREDLLYEDFDTMKDLTYGCAEGSTFARKFTEEYAVEAGFAPKIVNYANTTELVQALEKGEVDAVVTNIMFASEDLKLLGWFGLLQVYYISQQDNRELLEQVDAAMMQIMVEEPEFAAKLESSYFPIYDSTRITYLEQQYVNSLPEINVGFFSGEKPVAYQDEQTGEFTGIVRDILDRISENSGVKFKYIPITAADFNEDYLRENEIHVIANYEYGKEADFGDVDCSQPYMNADQVMIAREGQDLTTEDTMRIAVDAASLLLEEDIRQAYPNAEVSVYDDMEACFNAVSRRQADVIIGNRYVVDPYLNKPSNRELKVVQINGIESNPCIAAVTGFGKESDAAEKLLSDTQFISVMDKSINCLTSDEINNITISHTTKNVYDYTIWDFTYQYRYYLAALMFAAALVALLVWSNLKNKHRSVAEMEEKNRLLADAIEEANQANAAKGQFLAQMSHEIRTPMNAIIGLTAVAKTSVKDAQKTMDFLTKIEGSSRLLLGIINDILDMSAIENNKIKIASAEFDFKQCMTELTAVFYQQCRQKGIRFDLRMKGVTEEILMGDVLRVNQILMNLLSNAVKFTPAGGEVSVLIIQGSSSKNQVHMRFVISDTGCGMSEELKERLFRPFEQEDATTARKYGGSGLGLSITKNLVELMNGSIQVESEKNQGTVFTVDIPFGMTGRASAEEETRDFSDVRVLVVDDDEDSCQYTDIIMKRLGVACDYVTCGEEALERIGEAEQEGRPYDLCLVDWRMPGMNGVAVTEKIREIFGNDTMVIIVSAYDLSEIETDAKRAGADYFVPKPLFQSSVYNILMKISHRENSLWKAENADQLCMKYDFSGKKVLVAEDVALNMEVAVDLLKMVGVEPVCAEDGIQALTLYSQSEAGEYDAILLDINMPGKDGYQVAQEIRESGREDAKTVPIYAMTANAFAEDIARALNSGMDGHIAKPVETEVFYRTLDKAFRERKKYEQI